ncbi:ATP-binding protein [Leptolyngbya sp. AN02str]|uniref:ATP-binding protein n=1 Tax=Leptolyngbya sp. AN02str TaxID=3423363 RepID=UPI003D320FCB
MKPFLTNDVSLYELALNSEHPPNSLQISPTTFKSMVNVWMDLLNDLRIPATIWLKLPKGAVWQAELEQFRRTARAPHTIYSFTSSKDDGGDAIAVPPEAATAMGDADPATQPGTPDGPAVLGTNGSGEPPETNMFAADGNALIDDRGIVSATGQLHYASSTLFPIQAESLLKREYFFLVVSEVLSGGVLAHRPHSTRSRPANPDAAAEDEPERRHPLLAVCSVEPETLQRLFSGLYEILGSLANQAELAPEVELMVESWEHVTKLPTANRLDLAVFSHLLARQVQVQEDIWHGTAVYRRQAETAGSLQLRNEELENAIRLKDEFLKNVGQELRTPLTSMKTALTLLNSPNLKPAQKQRYMDLLTHECDRQSALITSVLDLLQLENTDNHADIQPIRLTDIVPGIVSTYQPLAQEKGVLLAYTISEDLPAICCTPSWLRQIVINLLHNGIKFTAKGGQVWVKAKQQGEYVQIDIRDTGIGIAQSDVPKIFDRFYRVRGTEDSSGAGLGLSIVQQLLLRCGGSISVKSRLGEGSNFSVLLPIAPQ